MLLPGCFWRKWGTYVCWTAGCCQTKCIIPSLTLLFLGGLEFGSLPAASFHETCRNQMLLRLLLLFQMQAKIAETFYCQDIRLKWNHLQKAQRMVYQKASCSETCPLKEETHLKAVYEIPLFRENQIGVYNSGFTLTNIR